MDEQDDTYGFNPRWLMPEEQALVYSRFNAEGELIVDGEAYVLSHFSANQDYAQRMLKAICAYIKQDDQVLSLAEGQGHLIAALQACGIKQIQGNDICEDNVRVAKAKGLPVSLGNVTALDHADAIFDVVIINESIGAIGLGKPIEEARRVLKPRGKLMITTYEYVIDEDKEVDSRTVKYKYVLPETVINALHEHGFDDVSMEPMMIEKIPQELIDDGQIGDSVNLIVAIK